MNTENFRKMFYPDVCDDEWNNWKWQLKNKIQSTDQLSRFLSLTQDEIKGLSLKNKNLPVSITPYYLSIINPEDIDDAIRKCTIPRPEEAFATEGEAIDPLSEEKYSPVHGIVHRYPDRVLFLVTTTCSVYCRYCTRSRIVGEDVHINDTESWEKCISYIQSRPEIRDVLISGGDPLTMSDEKIEWLLSRLRKIEHVEMIRIGTKVPVTLPQRITPELTAIIRKYHPVWMSIHFTHPHEITPETQKACTMLADAGIPLGSQTVLLKDINDNSETLKQLYHKLLKIRVKPYYLYQCDPIEGSVHFRTSIEKGLEIIQNLRGYTSGYAVPNYVIDAPKGGGKIVISPDNIVQKSDNKVYLRNFKNEIYEYPNNPGSPCTDCVQEYANAL
ncbi:MAG: lysine 2,3-aminomutase [Candidatus Melainabacteria bacterium GWF2_37_15]|nr:MAG: lysine 2,3-aminomutase [Candidatus Melainabacteria bacterium GWF2_37_15]